MKVLFIVPYTPTRIRTRSHNLMAGLFRRGHDVTLAALWENDEDRAALREWEQRGVPVLTARLTRRRALWNSLRALPTGLPLQARYCWQPALASALRAQVSDSRFDVIHVEHLRGAAYGLCLRQPDGMPRVAAPVVWDSVDCISYLFEQSARQGRGLFAQLITRLELPRTRRYEAWLVGQFAQVLVTSEADRAALAALGESGGHAPAPVHVIGNGVDLEYFRPTGQAREAEALVFSGKMSYHANVAAALRLVNDIMPLVWSRRPDVCVRLVGKDPPRALLRLARDHPSRVVVTGTVADIRTYLGRATVAVCPMPYAAGIQNKVLEAMAMATPVVASRQAVRAVQAVDGEHLLAAGDDEEFAGHVVRLLSDADLCRRLGAAGRSYVERYHDWASVTACVEDRYVDVIRSVDQAGDAVTSAADGGAHAQA